MDLVDQPFTSPLERNDVEDYQWSVAFVILEMILKIIEVAQNQSNHRYL
jgi:hypothetical protein